MVSEGQSFQLDKFLIHHVVDGHEWKVLPFLPHLPLPFGLSVHGVMIILISLILIVLGCSVANNKQRVPTGLRNLLEVFILFIRDEICIKSLGESDGRKMTPFFATLFFFIFCLNYIGLIPAFATATSNYNVTAALAIMIFLIMTIGTMMKVGVGGFFKAFIFHGVPLPVKVLLFILELLGVIIKPLALMIRLAANMLAGHLVILSLLGLLVLFGAVAAPAIILAVCIYLLEVLVCALQAYIFVLLSAIFIGQVQHPQH